MGAFRSLAKSKEVVERDAHPPWTNRSARGGHRGTRPITRNECANGSGPKDPTND